MFCTETKKCEDRMIEFGMSFQSSKVNIDV